MDSTPLQFAVRQAPLHKPFHRAIDRFPTGLEDPRRFPPTQPPRPARQESHHGAGHRTLAVAPGNVLDDDPVLGTLHPPRRVAETRSGFPTAAQIASAAPASGHSPAPAADNANNARVCRACGCNVDLDGLRLALAAMHSHLAVDEAHETLHTIQDGLNL